MGMSPVPGERSSPSRQGGYSECSTPRRELEELTMTVKELLKNSDDGKLPAYAWPGGCPILYLDGDDCVLCPECANRFLRDELKTFRPKVAYLHEEGPPETCEQCGKEVESAYSDPDAPETNEEDDHGIHSN